VILENGVDAHFLTCNGSMFSTLLNGLIMTRPTSLPTCFSNDVDFHNAQALLRRRLARATLGASKSKHLAISKTGIFGISPSAWSPNTSSKKIMLSKIFPATLFSRALAIPTSFEK
jgi:hypothetical protein